MATVREEAAPSFDSWKQRLERAAPDQLQAELEQFLLVLTALGTPMIDGAKVHFVYHDPDAAHVTLAGEFNEWGRRNDAIQMERSGDAGLFFHTLTVTEPARLEYKFIVDGEWKPDPLCHHNIDNGVGGQNSFFVVGEFHDPPELEWIAEAAHGRVEEFEFESARLLNKRRVYVYLPAAYDRDSSARFPTFYVHDGGEYLERARMSTVMDNLIHSGDLPPMVVVMIDPVNRMREYWANDGYRDFLCDEFIPAIEDRYRTIADRDSRGVMGASLGGLISTYVALSRPQLFSKVAGQSSGLQLDENKLASLLGAVEDTTIKFYFDVGTYEPRFIPAHERFVALLKQKRWPCFYQELAGGHNWTSWRAHLKDLLVFLWGKRSP
jgi:enterochelin esterase family protein